jgi:hypothetical protein
MSSLENPDLGLFKRKRGGQPGNTNRLKHGRRSKRLKEGRRAKWRAEWREQELKSLAWSASCPKTDYAAILEEIRRERAERALTEPELWGPI